MEITYESICKKLGFDPLTTDSKEIYPQHKDAFFVDDAFESPFKKLFPEELDFLIELYREKKIKTA
ncbi:MAG: hypothetical protein IJJ69_14165 [Oscillospiraceae bacterium]|nr:hypothetical protein [Oscillospiraceae bacterium]